MKWWIRAPTSKPATFQALRKVLGGAKRPAHYLAIPPQLFETVVEHLEKSGCAKGARVLVEKPFGRDLAFRIDHFLGKRPVNNLHFFRFANAFLEPIWNHH